MVVFVDPRAEPGRVVEPYEAPDLGSVEPLRIGLLANGFPDSVAFLDQVQTALAARLPGVAFERYDKGDASSVIGPAMLDDLVERCQAVVAAYGH